MLPSTRARSTRSSSLVVPPVSPRSRSSSATSSVARSSRRASTPTRLLPTVPPSRPVSSLERPPPPRLPISSFSMSFPSPLVSPWRATSSLPSSPVDKLFLRARHPPLYIVISANSFAVKKRFVDSHFPRFPCSNGALVSLHLVSSGPDDECWMLDTGYWILDSHTWLRPCDSSMAFAG